MTNAQQFEELKQDLIDKSVKLNELLSNTSLADLDRFPVAKDIANMRYKVSYAQIKLFKFIQEYTGRNFIL